MIHLATSAVTKIHLGADEVTKIHLGTDLVFGTTSPVASSIVALWDFESAGRGDDSANSNDLTIVGSPTYAAGKIGDAAGGFTTTKYFQRAASVGPFGTNARTVSAWFKTSDATAASGCILTVGGGTSAGQDYLLCVENGVIFLRMAGGRVASFGAGFNNGAWRYITATYASGSDLSDVVMMVDGAAIPRATLANDGPINLTSVNGTTVGGNTPSGSDRHFTGELDQVLVADREWSLSDHEFAYNLGSGRATSELLTP